MKKLIISLIVFATMATPCLAQVRQFTTSKQGNMTTVYDASTGRTYYLYDQTPAQPQPLQVFPLPQTKGPDLFPNVPADKKWMYED